MSAQKNFFLTDLGYSIFQVPKTDEWIDDIVYRVRDYIFTHSAYSMDDILHFIGQQDVLDALAGVWDIQSAAETLVPMLAEWIVDEDNEPDFDAKIALTMGHRLP